MKSIKILLSLALALGCLSAAQGAQALGNVDQGSIFDPNTVLGLRGNPATYSQSFTAGATGELDRVTIKTYRSGALGDTIVRIFATANGLPTGNALATQNVPEGNISTTGFTLLNIDFSTPASVVAGTEYAFVVNAPTNSNFYLDISAGSGYPTGTISLDSGSGFSALAGSLMFFETYVTPVAVIPPSTPVPATLANTGNSTESLPISAALLIAAGITLLLIRRWSMGISSHSANFK